MNIIKFRVMVRRFPEGEAHEVGLNVEEPYSGLLHEDYDGALQELKKAQWDASVAFANIKEVKEKTASISEIIEDVKTQMCSFYCRYPYQWDAVAEGLELSDSPYCRSCPLGRL